MLTRYQTLFTISLRHDYFADQKYKAFGITPLAETSNYLHRRGLLARISGNEICILTDTGTDGKKIETLYNEQYTLRFALTLQDPYFYNYTNGLSENLSEQIYYFSNTTADGSYKAKNDSLHKAASVTERDAVDLKNFENLFLSKPFAIIDIQLYQGMLTDLNINFEAKATYWKYLITSNHLMELEESAIISDSKAQFDGPETITLANKATALAFQSKSPIKLSQYPSGNFSLVENYTSGSNSYRVVIRRLPAADVRYISNTAPQNGQLTFSEIFI